MELICNGGGVVIQTSEIQGYECVSRFGPNACKHHSSPDFRVDIMIKGQGRLTIKSKITHQEGVDLITAIRNANTNNKDSYTIE